MNTVREITRWVPRWGRFIEPTAQLVSVRLIESGGRYYLKSPWAMVDAYSGADTDEKQLAAIVSPCFTTEAEAVEWAKRECPHWYDKRNDAVRTRLYDSIEWHGDYMGPAKLADAMNISEDRLRNLGNGKYQATPKEKRLALAWKGGTV